MSIKLKNQLDSGHFEPIYISKILTLEVEFE
jgi:hypothetical protein